MTPAEKIEKAMENLTNTITQNGYVIDDLPTGDLPDNAVELYRYPPDTYDFAICAIPQDQTGQH